MKSGLLIWRLIMLLLATFVIAPLSLRAFVWSLKMTAPYYWFLSFLLFVGFIFLFEYCKYLFRGYRVYDSRCEILIYKEIGRDILEFDIQSRCQNDKYEGSDILVPTDAKWRREMPDWAKRRKTIIIKRILKCGRSVDKLQIVER